MYDDTIGDFKGTLLAAALVELLTWPGRLVNLSDFVLFQSWQKSIYGNLRFDLVNGGDTAKEL